MRVRNLFFRNPRRRGSATVEMAVVTPLLLTMLFGIIEYGWVFSVRQALIHAARDGARTAALPGSTDTEVTDQINRSLTPMGLSSKATIDLTRADAGNDFTETVHITVPYADVTLVGGFFGSTSYNLGATCAMRKEGFD